MDGYNFTERVRNVLASAQEEAVRLRHEYVGTEHILLGLIREGEGVAMAVLESLHIDLEEIQQNIEKTVNKGKPVARPERQLPFTSKAKKVLELAMSEARELNHSYVGTEHLLLGLLREDKGIAAQVLTDANLNVEEARAETLRLLGTDVPPPPRNAAPAPARGGDSDFDPGDVLEAGPAAYRLLKQCTPRLRTVVLAAVDMAHQRSTFAIEPEHLLVALFAQQDGMAAIILEGLQVDRGRLREKAAAAAGEIARLDSHPRPRPFSFVALAALRDARYAARAEGSDVMGTDHLLVGLLGAADKRTVEALSAAGVTIERVVRERERVIG